MKEKESFWSNLACFRDVAMSVCVWGWVKRIFCYKMGKVACLALIFKYGYNTKDKISYGHLG